MPPPQEPSAALPDFLRTELLLIPIWTCAASSQKSDYPILGRPTKERRYNSDAVQ